MPSALPITFPSGGVRPRVRAARFFLQTGTLVAAAIPIFLGTIPGYGLSPEDVLTVRVTAEVEGSGPTARQMAVDRAELTAMEELIRSWVPETNLEPFRGLMRHVRAYVKQTDVLRTTRDGNLFRLEADVTFRELPLRRDLAAALLPRLPQKPALALIARPTVPDNATGEMLPGRAIDPAVRRLAETLEQLGFSVHVPELDGRLTAQSIETAFQGGVEQVGTMARQLDQTFLLACEGSVNSRPVQPQANVLRVEATFNARLFRCEDGKMLESLGITSILQSVEITEGARLALEDAAAKLTTDCVSALILAAAALRTAEPDAALIIIEQPPDADTVESLAAVLRELPETVSAEVLASGPVLGRIRVRTALHMAELADLLQQTEVGPYRLELKKAVGRDIQLQIVPR